MSKQNNSLIPLISTIVVAVLAIVVVIVALVVISGDNAGSSADSGSSAEVSASQPFEPTQELVDECTYAAHDLVADNYRILRLFVTEGLPHEDEPYGNIPEDGLYTVSSSEYKSLQQIEELVHSVFVEEEAVRVLGNMDGKGLAVYQNREKLVKADNTDVADGESAAIRYEKEYVLGISADFVPDTDYAKDWSSCRIAIIPRSETLCELTVYLDGLDENTASSNSESVLSVTMVKVEQDWRLEKFVY